MNFTKWVNIENYSSKFIEKFLEVYPELTKETFIITEKIDGANFSIAFFSDGHFQPAKRSGWINDNFYNYKEIFKIEQVNTLIEVMLDYCQKKNKQIQFVGELFGYKVQDRIFYGNGRYWRWFAIYEINKEGENKNLNIEETFKLCDEINDEYFFDIMSLYVPIIGFIAGLERAAGICIEIKSALTPKDYNKQNFIEGIVIRPSKNYILGSDNFILKIKNERFKDRPKLNEKKFNVSENAISLIEKIRDYVNENRTADLFSKYGKISDIKQLGEYIKFYVQDVLEDFLKDYPLDYANVPKDEQKTIRKSISAKIKEELFKRLI